MGFLDRWSRGLPEAGQYEVRIDFIRLVSLFAVRYLPDVDRVPRGVASERLGR
jgi:hypothetical protein